MTPELKELERRGFVKQCSDLEALDRLLANETVSLYCGLDPTASSLHAGHIVPLYAMAHLGRAGHRPIVLIGSGTARIGDPTGKTEMRKMLSVEQIRSHAQNIIGQVERFFSTHNVDVTIVDNSDWLASLNYIDFLRDIGVHFSVNRMLSFETYKMRMETGLSFIEFNYQLLQSFDFLTLYRDRGCKLQIGGDDQWGNIISGADLIRRVEGGEAHALTCPLVTRSDGKKMGKTEKGALFLDPSLISPYEFFQYWRNVPDGDVEKFLLLYTFLPVEEAKKLGSLRDREINRAKEVLAHELTAIVHGKDEADRALEAARAAFSEGGAAGGDATAAIPSLEISRVEISAGINAVELFERTTLCSSRSDARRLIGQGGASVNGRKVDDVETIVDDSWIDEGKLLLRAGKKRYFQIVVTK